MLSRKIILLDIGNVLVNVNFAVFCSAVSRHPESEPMIFKKFCASRFKDDFDRGLVSIAGFLETVAADPIVRSMAMQELKKAWQSIFSLREGCVEGVRRLKERHRIWIMSDTDPLHFAALLNEFPILHNMERYYLSYEHGFLKSSPEAFLHVMRSSSSEAGELLLVDDKPDNCLACKGLGIESIRFTGWDDTLGELELV